MTFREAYTLHIELMGRAYQFPPELNQTHKELLEELRGIRDLLSCGGAVGDVHAPADMELETE